MSQTPAEIWTSSPPSQSRPRQESHAIDESRTGAALTIPLVVDLDGTLTPTDTLVESTIQAVKHHPALLLRIPFWLMQGRASFKQRVATLAGAHFNPETLPYNEPLLAYLRSEKARGRQLVLATAADGRIAQAVADHLSLFDTVIASNGIDNLKGEQKRRRIQETVGPEFSYAGDHAADLPVWAFASAAVLVGVSPRVAEALPRQCPVEQTFSSPKAGLKDWMRALRVHQWIKNILLFVPLLTAFSLFDLGRLSTMLMAFMAFSLVASATYIVNDLLDLDSDRAHPRKRTRPFASAQIGILTGAVAGAVLLVLGLTIAALISVPLLLTLLLYLVITSSYTWALKRYVLIDVVILSVLYTLRILAGSIAAGVQISSWLAAFSLFIFLSLALVKRCAELVALSQGSSTLIKGRDYRVSDLPILWPLGVGSALSAVVVFGMFINAADTQERYNSPQLLWGAAVVMIYWTARLWIKTGRGEMHDDPIVYSLTNTNSLVCIAAMVGITVVAQFFHVGWL